MLSNSQNVKRIYCCIVLIYGLYQAILGCIQLCSHISRTKKIGIISGSLDNSGIYAVILAIIAPLAFYNLLRLKNSFRLLSVIDKIVLVLSSLYTILILTLLPMTMSRTGWFAAISGCAVVLLMHLKSICNWSNGKLKLITFLIFCLLLISAIPAYLLKQNSADGRLLIWKISTTLIPDNIFTGVGNFAGAYGEAQEAYFRNANRSENDKMIAGAPDYAYNEYLQVLIEDGIVGLVIFIGILFLAFYNLFKSDINNRIAVIGMMTSITVAMSFSYPLHIFETHLLIFAITILAITFPRNEFADKYRICKETIAVVLLFIFSYYLAVDDNKIGNGREAKRQWDIIRGIYVREDYEDLYKLYAPLYPYLDSNPEFLLEYGRCLSCSGLIEKSNEVLYKGLKVSSDPMFCNVIGRNYMNSGDYDKAEAMFKSAFYRIPHKKYPLYLLMLLYEKEGRHDKVIEMAELILSLPDKINSEETRFLKNEAAVRCR